MSTPIVGDLKGGEAPAHLIRPEQGPSHTLIVYLHWFDEAPNANRDQFLDEAKAMASNGFASVLPQLSFPWKIQPAGLEKDTSAIQSEVERLEDLTRQAKTVTATERLVIVGHDFGAMHGLLLAGKTQPACVVAIAPTPRWSDWFLAFWPIEGDRYDYMRGLEQYDPVAAVGDLDMPKLFQFARNDFYIAPMSGQELVQASSDPRRLEAYDTDHSMAHPECRADRIRFIHETVDIETRPAS